MVLADYGADVIKVEKPGQGDDTRSWGPPYIENHTTYFVSINRNKKSIAIDMKREQGQTILREVIRYIKLQFVLLIVRLACEEK